MGRRSILLSRRFRLRELHGDEAGMALVMAVGITLVLTIITTAVLSFAASGTRDASRSADAQTAAALAESGVNNALSILGAAYTATPGVDFYSPPSFGRQDPATLLPPRTSTTDEGSVTWSGTYCMATNSPEEQAAGCNLLTDFGLWRLKGVATVVNPTGPAASPLVSTVRLNIQAVLPPNTAPSSGLWNWVFSGAGPTPRNPSNTPAQPDKCDTIIPNSVQVSAPLYVAGNLCLQNGSNVVQPTAGSPPARVGQKNRLVVGGFLRNDSPSSSAGANSALGRLTEATIRDLGRPSPASTPPRGCTSKGNDAGNKWVFNACGDGDKVFVDAGELYTTPTETVVAPLIAPLDVATCPASGDCIDLNNTYAHYSHPGPRHPCTTVSTDTPTTQVPPSFDNTTTRDNSLPTVQNLTPAKSYVCRTVAGELSWNHSTRVLTVKGPLFFDGSIVIDPPALATYAGRGAIFASGTFALKNASLCALKNADGTNCDYDNWDPNVSSGGNALSVAAFGNCANGGLEDDQVACGGGDQIGVQIKSANFQGLLYARHDIDIVTTARSQGPMVTPAKVRFGQSSLGTFPPLTILPTGTPGTPLPPATLGPPQDWRN